MCVHDVQDSCMLGLADRPINYQRNGPSRQTEAVRTPEDPSFFSIRHPLQGCRPECWCVQQLANYMRCQLNSLSLSVKT